MHAANMACQVIRFFAGSDNLLSVVPKHWLIQNPVLRTPSLGFPQLLKRRFSTSAESSA